MAGVEPRSGQNNGSKRRHPCCKVSLEAHARGPPCYPEQAEGPKQDDEYRHEISISLSVVFDKRCPDFESCQVMFDLST